MICCYQASYSRYIWDKTIQQSFIIFCRLNRTSLDSLWVVLHLYEPSWKAENIYSHYLGLQFSPHHVFMGLMLLRISIFLKHTHSWFAINDFIWCQNGTTELNSVLIHSSVFGKDKTHMIYVLVSSFYLNICFRILKGMCTVMDYVFVSSKFMCWKPQFLKWWPLHIRPLGGYQVRRRQPSGD